MATPFSDVFDLFMQLQNDYRLMSLYTDSEEDFTTYLQGWLMFAIVEFSECCTQDLSCDDSKQEFDEDLTLENKTILAELMVKYWLNKEVQDVLMMRLSLQDADFKHYAESQNLQAKSQHLDKVIEKVSQRLNDYSYKHFDWSNWLNGNFGA